MVEAPGNLLDLRFKFRNGDPVRLQVNDMTDAEFYELCLENPELRIERNPQGQIIVMPPTSAETGRCNAEIATEIGIWNRKHPLGHIFDSSTGFKLPNGANRSPDAAWISKPRWAALRPEDQQRFAPIVPDFVVELRSSDQPIAELREKMEEYRACGCRLGWLIDPQNRRTYVFLENGDIQTVQFEVMLLDGDVLPNLEVRWSDLLD